MHEAFLQLQNFLLAVVVSLAQSQILVLDGWGVIRVECSLGIEMVVDELQAVHEIGVV